jgi:hypothetical protein
MTVSLVIDCSDTGPTEEDFARVDRYVGDGYKLVSVVPIFTIYAMGRAYSRKLLYTFVH